LDKINNYITSDEVEAKIDQLDEEYSNKFADTPLECNDYESYLCGVAERNMKRRFCELNQLLLELFDPKTMLITRSR
jgi:hypothetical protein